jgi:nucleotide-binding universal stress UspA family protein
MLEKILVPLDGSPRSALALDVALKLVTGPTSTVTLLMVDDSPHATSDEDKADTEPPRVASPMGGAAPIGIIQGSSPRAAEDRGQAVERREHEILGVLRDAGRPLHEAGATVDYKVAFGNAPDEIVRLARQDKFDLICMASHGRSGLQGVLHGSVTEAVIRSRVAPVLVVPMTEPAR